MHVQLEQKIDQLPKLSLANVLLAASRTIRLLLTLTFPEVRSLHQNKAFQQLSRLPQRRLCTDRHELILAAKEFEHAGKERQACVFQI